MKDELLVKFKNMYITFPPHTDILKEELEKVRDVVVPYLDKVNYHAPKGTWLP